MKNNKTIKTLKALQCDTSLIPEHILKHAYEIITDTAVGYTLEVGIMLSEDITVIQELSEYLPAVKIITSKQYLFDLRLKTGKEHVGFTHINGYYEDNIFYVLYAIPAQLAFKLTDDFIE
jgi:hypothetical protein